MVIKGPIVFEKEIFTLYALAIMLTGMSLLLLAVLGY